MKTLPLVFLLFLVSCESKDSRANFNIISKANCKGPNGHYHTELHATTDGYTRFHQRYLDGRPDYDAVSYNDTLGFTLYGETPKNWIKPPEISVGKGHSFHMIALKPEIVFVKKENKYFDATGNEVLLEYENQTNRIAKFSITNPFDPKENIEIIYSDWTDVQGVELPMKVRIIQGGKDEYFFNFYDVKINDPGFSKVGYENLSH